MTTTELLAYYDELTKKGREIMAAKNHDYTGGQQEGKQHDAFANFHVAEQLDITTTERALLVRLSDKFKRIITFVNKGVLLVKDESVEDTIVDARNYLAILGAIIRERRNKQEPEEALRKVHSIFDANISSPFNQWRFSVMLGQNKRTCQHGADRLDYCKDCYKMWLLAREQPLTSPGSPFGVADNPSDKP